MGEKRSVVSFDEGYHSGHVQGLRAAVEIIGDLESRTVGTGSMRELMVAAYQEAQKAILRAVALAEASRSTSPRVEK